MIRMYGKLTLRSKKCTVMATILITKFTKEKVLYTQKVFSTSAQFCVAAETKTRRNLLSMACVPHPWGQKKKQWGTNPQKSWIVRIVLSATRLLCLAVVCQYLVGLGWAPLSLTSARLVSAPCHTCASRVPWQCCGSCSRTWELAMGEIPSLYICTSLYWRGTAVSCHNLGQSSWWW